MGPFQKGYVVAVLLAVLTVVEYVFAVQVGQDTVRFVGLAASALAKAWLIIQYFMHITRCWKTEGAH
jgi:heme/copper-type cytochrome/quinol oxidase subunit 4